MVRIRFYTGSWSGPPAAGDCYEVPRNPQRINPEDSAGDGYGVGLDTGFYSNLTYDNRNQYITWTRTPATDEFVEMVNNLKSYVGYDYVYANFGNSLVVSLYGTGDAWYKIRVTSVPIDRAPGSESYISGTNMYNYYNSIQLNFRIIESM